MKSQSELIKTEIERLHHYGSSNWQSLSSQVRTNYKTISYNILQMMMELCMTKKIVVECGRGGGKSTGISGQMKSASRSMPRSNNNLIGCTYKDILTRTLPSTILGLEKLGLFKDLHYFVGRKPPRSWNWPEPYMPPLRYDNTIYFYTGAVYNMISHDKTDDGRGQNTDSELADEAALLDKSKLDKITTPTLRGSNLQEFKKSPYFLSSMYVSTTPLTPEGFWFVELEEVALLNPKEYKFLKATCEVNAHNLPDDYLEKAKINTLPWIYEAEYLNIRPNQIKGGFYALLSDKVHTYTNYNYNFYSFNEKKPSCQGDNDLSADHPLILGVDWGAVINAMAVLQHLAPEIRALKSFYALGDDKKIQDDMFAEFIEYYSTHKTKKIYLWYDNSGNNKTGNTRKTRAEQAKAQLEKAGWSVTLMTKGGRNEYHEEKHMTWEKILEEKNPRLPIFRINKGNCKELWISMVNAKVKQGSKGEIKKDKSSEKSKKIKRQHATDLSDAIDAPVFGMFSQLVRGKFVPLPG